jgi:GT2 family glycosyltransferase
MAGAAPRLIDLVAHPQGGLELIHDEAQAGDRYLVRDDLGATFEIAPVREVFGREIAVDLLDHPGNGVAPWRLDDGRDLLLDLDSAALAAPERWRRAASRIDVVHRDPLSGGATPVRAGEHFRLLLRGRFEGEAEVRAEILDRLGQPIDTARRAVRPGEADLTIPVAARTGAVALRVTVSGPAAMTLERPRLLPVVEAGVPGAPHRLSRRLLFDRAERGWRGQAARVRLPLLARLLDGEPHRLTVTVSGASGEVSAETAFRFEPQVQLTKQGVERASLVRLVGRHTDPVRRYLSLQFCIDGRLSPPVTVKAAANGKFDARLPIPRPYLDGRPHRIEVREASSQAVLFAAAQPVAAFLARWPTLQQWAQPPMSPESAPAAPHHRRAFEAWARRAGRGEPVPPVAALHQELLGGVRRRTSWPRLAFPEVSAPRVAVVMPAHDRFEVTYSGLCALLFAPNDTDFEVVVVDDGSSDETARIEDIVSGVRVVRHRVAQGFVGACNDGAAAARGELIVFLNNDTEVTAGWLDALAAPFEAASDVGLTGAKLIYPDNRLQEAGGIVWGTGDPWNAGRGGDPDDPAWSYPRVADYLSGAAIMIPRTVWDEVGGFGDEWAPAYFEDTDLAFKVKASGRRVLYVPAAEVYHFEGQTAGTDKSTGIKLNQELNRPKFKQKWKALYEGHGSVVGQRPDLEKDRGAASRTLIVLDRYPDDGVPPGLAAQIAAIRARAGKPTLLAWDLAWRPPVRGLAALGAEPLHAPYVDDPLAWLLATAADFDEILPGPGVDPAWLERLCAHLPASVRNPIGRL